MGCRREGAVRERVRLDRRSFAHFVKEQMLMPQGRDALHFGVGVPLRVLGMSVQRVVCPLAHRG